MKTTKNILTAATAIALAMTTITAAQAATFSDVSATHWANAAISRAADAGIMTGTGGNRFAPSQTLTKAEFTTILSRAFYSDDYAVAQATETDSWYAPALKVGNDHHLFAYTDRGNMDITEKINRYDMAAMIYGLLVDKRIDRPTDAQLVEAQAKIADWNSIPEEFRKSVATCYYLGLLTGADAKGSFNGSAYTDRASTAVVYGRLADKFGGGTYTPPKEEVPQQPATTELPPFKLNDGETAQQMMNRLNAATPAYREGYLTNGKPITDENIQEMVEEMLKTMPEGTPWSADVRYRIRPSKLYSGGIGGCGSFAEIVSDYIFGEDAPMVAHTDYTQIKVGDVVWGRSQDWSLESPGHIYFVAGIKTIPTPIGTTIHQIIGYDGNSGSKVGYGSESSIESMKSNSSTREVLVFSRY